MEKKLSIQELINSARADALGEFKKRFQQKWLFDLPVFQWSDLQLTEELKSTVYTENPTIWLLRDKEDVSFLDKVWRQEDVVKIISFDHIENVEISPEDPAFDVWLEEDIECGLGMINTLDATDLIICFTSGSGEFSSDWAKAFIKRTSK
ncbi:MAG: hypothetical protein WED10_00170 [Brumimicrobium sp.]